MDTAHDFARGTYGSPVLVDMNKDGKPDAYQFIKTVDDTSHIVRKEVDVNFDGKVDLIRVMDDKGNLVEERLDSDFDGRIDLGGGRDRGHLSDLRARLLRVLRGRV